MAQTYSQLQKQIEALRREADKLKQKEIEEVVAGIKEAVAAYELTPEMIFGRTAKGPGQKHGSKSKGPIGKLYRDPTTGAEWAGRGPRPRWLRELVDAGREPSEFLVQ